MAATRVKRVPATTANITKGIINYLARRGHFACRINNTGLWDEAEGRFRRSNTTRGTPDIIACINMAVPLAGWPPSTFCYGQFMGIEIKNKLTRDTQSEAQKLWQAECGAAHGAYVVAVGYNEFVAWFESIYGKT